MRSNRAGAYGLIVSVRLKPGISTKSPKGPDTASRSSSPGDTLTVLGFALEIRSFAVTSRPAGDGVGCCFGGGFAGPIVVVAPLRAGGWMKAAASVERPSRTSITITSLRAAIRRGRELEGARSQIA